MTNKQRRCGYGSWQSPITAELVARQNIRFGDLLVDEDVLYWVEGRPAEKGRSVIVQHTPDGQTRDVVHAPFSARSRVHEYGGGAFAVSKGVVYFVNFEDPPIYARDLTGGVQPITVEDGNGNRIPAITSLGLTDSSVYGVVPDSERENDVFTEDDFYSTLNTRISWFSPQSIYPIYGIIGYGWAEDAQAR